MMQTFEDVHPNIYAYLYKADATFKRQQLEAQLTQPLSITAFHDSLEPFVDGFGDGHTLVTSVGSSLQTQLAQQSVDPNSYTFSVPKPSVALIDFRAMEGLERFKTFLNDTFTQVKARGLTTLIVDLRNNGGGNSALGSALMDYLTDQPYRLFSRYEAKVSAQMTAYTAGAGQASLYPLGSPVGSVYKNEEPFVQPTQNPLRFKGKVYVLISSYTFSSALALTSAFKDFKIATLVGEETSASPSDYGEVYPFKLPNTGLEVWTSSTYWVRPSGFDDGRGVLPDVNVPSPQALEWVLEQVK